MRSTRLAFRITAAVGAVALSSVVALAHGPIARDAPVDRLVRNLEARLEESPDDADLHYMLGRLHAMAFELKSENVPVRDLGRDDPGERWWPPNVGEVGVMHDSDSGHPPTDTELRGHLAQ